MFAVNQALAVVVRETLPAEVKTRLTYYERMHAALKAQWRDYCDDCRIIFDRGALCAKCQQHKCQTWNCSAPGECLRRCSRCVRKVKCSFCKRDFCSNHLQYMTCGCQICNRCTAQCESCNGHDCGASLNKCHYCESKICSSCVTQGGCKLCSQCGFCQQEILVDGETCKLCETDLHDDCWKDEIEIPLCRACANKCQLKGSR